MQAKETFSNDAAETIAEIQASDADLFYKLCNEFYSSNATKRGYDQASAELTFKQVISKHENLWGYFILGENNVPIGYALITSYWCNEEAGNVIILDELFIDPAYRHHHYAKTFMDWLETEFSDKAVALTLEVLSTNVAAKELYVKEGFEEDGFVTMTKTIKRN